MLTKFTKSHFFNVSFKIALSSVVGVVSQDMICCGCVVCCECGFTRHDLLWICCGCGLTRHDLL